MLVEDIEKMENTARKMNGEENDKKGRRPEHCLILQPVSLNFRYYYLKIDPQIPNKHDQ